MQRAKWETRTPIAPMARSTLAVIAALELTPLPQTIRELSFDHQVSLRPDEADDERYGEPSKDCNESLIPAMHVMPVLRLAGLRAFNVPE